MFGSQNTHLFVSLQMRPMAVRVREWRCVEEAWSRHCAREPCPRAIQWTSVRLALLSVRLQSGVVRAATKT